MAADTRVRRAWLETALLTVGIACLGYYGYQTMEARDFQREQTAALETLLSAPVPPVPAPESVSAPLASSARASRTATTTGALAPGVIALLEIPRLKVVSPIVSGDDEAALARGVGHLADTPRPWERGNSALAAHRDSTFRPLRRIAIGDRLRVRSTHGDFTYEVRETRIVEPDDVSVLDQHGDDRLTLITCYPFNYIGDAPQRFIVHATRMP